MLKASGKLSTTVKLIPFTQMDPLFTVIPASWGWAMKKGGVGEKSLWGGSVGLCDGWKDFI